MNEAVRKDSLFLFVFFGINFYTPIFSAKGYTLADNIVLNTCFPKTKRIVPLQIQRYILFKKANRLHIIVIFDKIYIL